MTCFVMDYVINLQIKKISGENIYICQVILGNSRSNNCCHNVWGFGFKHGSGSEN